MKWLWGVVVVVSHVWAGQAIAQTEVVGARFVHPTDRYPHNIMGSLPAYGALEVELARCKECTPAKRRLTVRLPQALVFEDFAPRLVDFDGDGKQDILVVESDQQQGARLALWELRQGRLVRGASTSFIGTRFRWLAPVGVADFLNSGTPQIAYVEKPHLDKVLRLVRRQGDRLVPVDEVLGVTNHLIGQEDVQSRIESCPKGPVILALSSDAQRVLAVDWTQNAPSVRDIGAAQGQRLPKGLSACVAE